MEDLTRRALVFTAVPHPLLILFAKAHFLVPILTARAEDATVIFRVSVSDGAAINTSR